MKSNLSAEQLSANTWIAGTTAYCILLTALVLSGCTAGIDTTRTRDGKGFCTVEGAFRHRWWNYYERGLSCAEGEFFTEALSDLDESVRQREKDQRMARTYGMHFVDYFPHRELGIIHYEMGNLAAAKTELELSLSQFPSSKAQFYLDRVRRDLTKQEQRDVRPPILKLDLKKDEIWTSGDPVIISGVAEDPHYISGITIAGAPLFLEQSRKQIRFEEALTLSQGVHKIEVAARNLMGVVTQSAVTIHVDREGPIISLDELSLSEEKEGKELVVSGSAFDESGIMSLTINTRPIAVGEGAESPFTERLPADGSDLELVARDRLGNETSARIPQPSSAASARLLLARAGQGGAWLTALLGPKDTTPPRINVEGLRDLETVFLDRIYLKIEVQDESKIAELSVNGSPIRGREGKMIVFSHIARLEEGRNGILFEAKDEAGNRAIRKMFIVREIPEAFDLEARLSMTVMPFEEKGEVPDESIAFQDSLINDLIGVKQDRFRIVERDRLDLILQEQNMSRTKLIDRKTALDVGRLVAAQHIVTGSIVRTRKGVEIVARVIDTETSEILAAKDVYDEVTDLLALRTLSEGMAVKIHQEFPLLTGLVVQRDGNRIISDLGKDRARIQRRLIVYREKPTLRHPVTGKVLGSDVEILGRARITQVMPDWSKAQILGGDKAAAIKSTDKVITE